MIEPTRRSFLFGAAGAAVAAGALPASLPDARRAPAEPQDVLVLGGTGFLGPHFVRSALARGHKVTLFHRGQTNPDLFPELEHLAGDREKGELDALRDRTFDAVIDTSGYVPGHVDATARLFADRAKHYQFISSVSVYAAFGNGTEPVDEDGEVLTVDDDTAAGVTTIRGSMAHYGALKARCEAAAAAAMPERTCVVRPGLIVGPGDRSDRFTWWPVRVDRGGEVLAPGDPDGRVQAIDVRDLADWMVHLLEERATGTYNAVGFAGPVSMQELLHGCKCATPSPVSFTWASEEFLQENEVGAWMEMPLWIPRGGRGPIANQRAMAQGLAFRPLADTIRDTLQWARTERGDRPFERTGVRPEREAELLEKWHARAASGR
ncbi:MAG: NAD-dependent epimerase/dehydratase family protein [Planctomycetota bacterium]